MLMKILMGNKFNSDAIGFHAVHVLVMELNIESGWTP